MKKIKYLVGLMFVSIFCCFLTTPNTHAELVKNSLTVSPQHQSVTLLPGETFRGSIKISSQASSDVDTNYEVLVGPFSQMKSNDSKDDYGDVNYIDSSTYNQIVDWIKIESDKGTISPNQTKIIPFTITVPEDAPAGGQYASIIVRDVNPNLSQGDGLAVNSVFQILSILYADVAGETRQDGTITDNSMPSFLLNSPLEATSMVKNTGNVHTEAEYTLQVWPLFSDEEICTNEENPEKSLIMPDTERYHLQSCDLPSVGIFRVKQAVRIFDIVSITEKTVIICPLWLLFVIILIVGALLAWIIVRVKANKKRIGASSRNSAEE